MGIIKNQGFMKTKTEKTYIIECANSGGAYSMRPTKYSYSEGTLAYLIDFYSYTLECGASYQSEKGNKKINKNPAGIDSLLLNLNNAVNNSAANGYSGKYFSIAIEKRQ